MRSGIFASVAVGAAFSAVVATFPATVATFPATVATFPLIESRTSAQLRFDRLDIRDPVPFHIEVDAGARGLEPGDADLARKAFDAWSAETGGSLQFVEVDSADEALVNLIWVSADSGLFGQAQRVIRNGKPGAIVFVTAEVNALGPDIAARIDEDPLLRQAIVYLTCVHELGHAVGLPHTEPFDDIMYSFGFGGDIVEYFMRYRRNLDDVDDIARNSGLSAGDRSALSQLYGSSPGVLSAPLPGIR